MKKTHTSKHLRIRLSILTGIIFFLLAMVVTIKTMHPDTYVFWFTAEAVCAVVAMLGVNDAMRKAASE